jgi:hypothetical protein
MHACLLLGCVGAYFLPHVSALIFQAVDILICPTIDRRSAADCGMKIWAGQYAKDTKIGC